MILVYPEHFYTMCAGGSYMDAIHLAEYLLKNLRERDSRLKDRIADGSISSWDEYRYLVGEIRGMAYVEDDIKTAMKGIELDDD